MLKGHDDACLGELAYLWNDSLINLPAILSAV